MSLVGAVNVGTGAAGFALGAMSDAIRLLYKVSGTLNDFMDEHVDALKRSDNSTVASTGRVLEGAKMGFGLGYASPVIVIAVGQLLLGNPLSAAAGVLSAVTLTNPVAMTCAAMGAIYYGWGALTEKEKDGILDRLRLGLEVGVELIRAIVEFVIRTAEKLFTSKQLIEFKDYIKAQALLFGRTLYDVTGKVGDLVKGAVEKMGEIGGDAVDATRDLMKGAYDAASEAASAGKETAGRIGTSISEGIESRLTKTKTGPTQTDKPVTLEIETVSPLPVKAAARVSKKTSVKKSSREK